MFPYFVLPIPFVLFAFVSLYPRRRGWLGRSPLGLAALAPGALYLADPSLWATFRVDEARRPYTPVQGRLFPVLGLVLFAFGLLALAFAGRRPARGRGRGGAPSSSSPSGSP